MLSSKSGRQHEILQHVSHRVIWRGDDCYFSLNSQHHYWPKSLTPVTRCKFWRILKLSYQQTLRVVKIFICGIFLGLPFGIWNWSWHFFGIVLAFVWHFFDISLGFLCFFWHFSAKWSSWIFQCFVLMFSLVTCFLIFTAFSILSL